MCFYFSFYVFWGRLQIRNRFVAVGIGNPIFPDFFLNSYIKQYITRGESGVLGRGRRPRGSNSSKEISQKDSKIGEIRGEKSENWNSLFYWKLSKSHWEGHQALLKLINLSKIGEIGFFFLPQNCWNRIWKAIKALQSSKISCIFFCIFQNYKIILTQYIVDTSSQDRNMHLEYTAQRVE